MIKIDFLLVVLCCSLGFSSLAQPNTDVYLLDINVTTDTFEMSSIENISNNEGYDNQPSFDGDGHLYFAKTMGNQTDIARYWMAESGTKIIHQSTVGSEYSPQHIPNSTEVAAVRLDTTGLQRLYEYRENEMPKAPLFQDLQIAYYAFFDEHQLLGSVLAGDHLDLVLANITTKKIDTLLTHVGRSIHKVPQQENTMSYTALNEEKNFDVYQLDLASRASFFVVQLPIGVQDMVWLNESKILIGSGSSLFMYDLFGNGAWKKVADLAPYNLKDITRLAVNKSGTQLALVAEPNSKTPSEIVQAHIEPYNTGNLDEFANAFSQNVVVRNFPKDTTSIGRTELKEGYRKFFANNTNLSVKVTNRLTHKNFVVDEEEGTVNNRTRKHATVYETGKDGILSMTFIHKQKTKVDPAIIVDQQLKAYNARDIDAFMATYSENVELFQYPNRSTAKGQADMRKGYSGFFNNSPDLHCEIINRIVIGNKVIDQEKVTSNGSSFGAIAIYEIENGLISKVTFLQ